MRHVIVRWIFGVVGLLLLTGCARPTPSPPAIPEEEQPPPVTLSIPFNVSPVEQPVIGRPPSLYLNPSSVSLAVGEDTTVQVWADGVGGVNTLFLAVSFDPLLIQVVDANPAIEGIQAAPGDLMPLVLENRVEGGRLVYQAAVPPDVAARDAGVVVSLSVRAIAPGTTSLRMEQVAAQDGAGNPVSVTPLADGVVTITGPVASPTAETLPPAPQPTVPATPAPSGTGGIYYIVEPGENLFRVGLKFGTTAQAIAAANNLADPRQIQAGTMVLVPVPAPGGGYGYYVRPGDTVYSIARRFGMTLEELVSLNNIGPDFTIHPGTILKVVPRR
ncbi:MAG: LysM peptidoglycan-binding domain-containing protein [Thermoflexales bacterium]|nr:LysM peptidoglycan-binding domain-containing protein [Thermoflexales bacterium]